MEAPDWSRARCHRFPISRDDDGLVRDDTWFQDAENALPVCNGDWIGSPCPVRAACARFALYNNLQRGVWGGFTEPQRRWIKRNVTNKELWLDVEHLRERVPPPEYFKDLGDEDPDKDEAEFREEQAQEAARIQGTPGVRGSTEDEEPAAQ